MCGKSTSLPLLTTRPQLILAMSCLLGFFVLTFSLAARAQGYERQVAAEWDFTKASDALGWSPAGGQTVFGMHDGALIFAATPDDSGIYSPEMAVSGRAMQRVEIDMSSNLAGPVQILWSPHPGRTSGEFRPGSENEIKMPSDRAVHHYYLPVNTQPGSTICQLELKIPPGATVAIERIRVVALAAASGSTAAPVWKFTENGNLLGWTPYSGVMDLSVSGGYLHVKAISNATILAPSADITNQLEWFSLFARVTHTTLESPWAQFNFVSVLSTNGLPAIVYFPLATDASTHVYNQNVAGLGGYWAGVSQVSVTFPENTDLDISEMELTTAPQGPADLAVDSFGPATPLLRAGRQFKVSCRVWDRGAATAEQVAVKLNLPAGGKLKLVTSPAVPASVSSGYPQILTWTLLANEPGSYPISVTADARSLSAKASTTLLVNPAVAAPKSSYVPVPVPAASSYNIGTYYFPGWTLDSHWDPIRAFPGRMPAEGYYAEGSPQVLDWQIKWAAEHGISFFAVDWYWLSAGQDGPPGEVPNGFLQAYSSASYRDSMKFCIAYADADGAAAGSVAEFENITKTWITKYFSQPGYLKIDGKPVVIIIGPDALISTLGQQLPEALNSARQLAKKAGFGGIYFVADTDASQVDVLASDGYDALSAYNYPGVGTEDPDESPASGLVTGYAGEWDTILNSSGIPYWIPTIRGWDPRPWAYYNAPEDLVRTGEAPQLFESMLEQAKSRIDAGRAPKVLLVEAWNELGEGSAIEPTAGDGFGYLDAIRSVFVDNSPHTDVVPSDVGLPILQVQPATSLWTFTGAADLAPWQVSLGPPYWDYTVGATGSRIESSQWTFTTAGSVDAVRMGFELSAQRYASLAITMSTSTSTTVDVFWGADDEPGISAVRGVGFTTVPGVMKTYTMPLAGVTGWRGNINLLRLSLSSASKTNVAIQSIQFLPPANDSSFAVSRNELDFRLTAGGAAPATQTLSIAGGVDGKLSWTAAAANASWLSLSKAKGTTPGNLVLSIHPAGLAVGVYKTTLEVVATGAGSGSVGVPVTLWVMPKAVKPATADEVDQAGIVAPSQTD